MFYYVSLCFVYIVGYLETTLDLFMHPSTHFGTSTDLDLDSMGIRPNGEDLLPNFRSSSLQLSL